MRRCLLASLALLWCTTVARADVFVIAPPYFTGSDGERVSDEIVRAILKDLGSQHRVLGPTEVAALVKAEERVWCREGACAERYREAAGAVAAIVVRVGRMGAGSGPATSFQIGIQPSPGVEYTKGALLSEGSAGELAVRALREAFREYRQGPGPWLEVTGAPEGATIYVDDREVGTLPRTLAVSVGSHQIRVEARTFAPMTKLISLQSATEREKLIFRLEPARVRLQDAAGRPLQEHAGTDATVDRGWRLWKEPLFYGGAAAVAGGVLIGLGASYKNRDGDCDVQDPAGVCSEFVSFGGRSKAILGGGISLAAVGVSLLTWGVIEAVQKKRAWRGDIAVSRSGFGFAVGRSL